MAGIFTPVPTGMLLTSGANSALTWTNAVSVSSMTVSSLGASNLTVSTLATSSSVTASTLTTGRLNYSSIVGSSISTNTLSLSLTNVSTQNTQIYQVATTDPLTSYTAIQASHVSTGTTNNALVLNPSGGNVGVGTTAPTATLHITNSTADPTIGPDFLTTGHGQILLRNTKAGSSPYSMSIGVDQTTGAGYMNAAGNSIIQPVCLQTRGGNVGVGTTTPIAPLHVYNSAGISLSNTSTVNYTQSATLGFNYGGGSVGTRDSFRIVSNVVNRDNGAGPTFYDYGAQADLVFQRKTNNLYSSGANDTTYTEVMRLGGATGNVGIGTTGPTATLHVLNPTAQAGNTTMVTAQIIGRPGTAGVQDGTSCGFAIGASGGLPNAASRMDVMVGGTAYSGNNWGYTPDIAVATFLGSGNVGIGTTTPTSALQVSASNASATTTLTVSNPSNANTGYGGQLYFDNVAGTAPMGSIAALRYNNAGDYTTYMSFSVAGGGGTSALTEKMRILPNGNVGIGTTTPGATLAVNGTFSLTGAFNLNSNISMGITTAIYMYYNSATNNAGFTTSGDGHVSIFTGVAGVANRLTVQNNGFVNIANLNTNGTVITTGGIGQLAVSSDRRIKENIVYQSDTQQGLANILNLKPASYRLIGKADTYLGFIAQDLEQEIPLAVDGKKYEWQWEEEDGKPKFDANGDIVYKLDADGNKIVRPRGVSDRAIIATQTLAIQELAKKLTAAEQQLAAKSAALDALIAWAQTQGYSVGA